MPSPLPIPSRSPIPTQSPEVRKPENSGNLRDLTNTRVPISSPVPRRSSDVHKSENGGNLRDLTNTRAAIPSPLPSPIPTRSHEVPSAQVKKVSSASPLKRKLESDENANVNGNHELRKKNKLGHDAKEIKEAVVEVDVVEEDEDSKLIALGPEMSSRALLNESVQALKEAKDRGLYDEYTNPGRVVRIPRSSWLMKPKKKSEEKKTSTEEKDTGALKRTLSDIILLKPIANSMKKKHSEEREGTSDDVPQENVRRTLSEAVKCRVQERRKRSELTASVKANLEEGFKDRRLDELSAQVASYAEKMGVQIRKSEVQDELYELQQAKLASQSQEICKLKAKLDAQKRFTDTVKLDQARLQKEVEEAKEELEAVKNLVGRMFVESNLKR